MKSKNKNILVITKNTIQYVEVKTGKSPNVEVKLSLKLKSLKDIPSKVKEVCEKHKFKSVSILVSDELIYILKLDLDYVVDKDGDLRNVISSKLEKSIPEHISDTIWDYKVISHTDRHYKIEVAAMNKEIYDYIHNTLDSCNVKIRHIKPFSVAISRVVNTNQYAVVLYFSNVESVIVLMKNNYVFFAASIHSIKNKEYILNLLNFIKQKYNLVDNTICIYSGSSKVIKPQDIKMFKVKPLMIEVAPYIGILRYDDTVKDDKFSLDLEQSNKNKSKSFIDQLSALFNKDHKNNANKHSVKVESSRNSTLKFLIPILLLLWVIAGIFLYKYIKESSAPTVKKGNVQKSEPVSQNSNLNNVKNNTNKNSNKPSDVNENVNNVKTDTTKDDTVNKIGSKYSVRVLNGTKNKENVSEIITALLGINDIISKIEVGEANIKNYEKTVISHKSTVSEDDLSTMKDALKTEYSKNVIVSNKPLQDSYKYDIEIIVGKK